MSFRRFDKLRLRAWFNECTEGGRRMPGDRAIATRLDFGSLSLVPSLIEEMASDGMISVETIGGERVITVLALPQQNTPGASGTARKASSAASSDVATRTTGRAPIEKPAPVAAPAAPALPEPSIEEAAVQAVEPAGGGSFPAGARNSG